MAPGANSYGSVAAVASLTRGYTNAGNYTTATTPRLAEVESWIDQVSATLNVALAKAGFKIPISQADAKLSLDAVVNEAVADLCHAANSAGRFFTERALERGTAPMKVIRGEMAQWVEDQAQGLEMLGATRSTSFSGQIAFRESDQSGASVPPIFERKGFGDQAREWDR